MWSHPDDSLLPGQGSRRWWEFQILVQTARAAVQESITGPVVVVAIGQRAVVETVVVDPIRDSLYGPRPGKSGDVLGAGGRHVGGPRLRSQFGGAVSIYGNEIRGEVGTVRNNCKYLWPG